MNHRRRLARTTLIVVALLAGGMSGCSRAPEASLERLLEARQRAADLHLQFTRIGDATNLAVMADTDDASVAFARESGAATQAVQKDADTLKLLFQGLAYTDEARLLEEFNSRFTEYRALDRSILDLAVENTNLKAQRLSFGPGLAAADAFRDALAAVRPLGPAQQAPRADALVATAVAAVREVQALQAPHIAEADDAAMTRIEQRMATAVAAARGTLTALAPLVTPESRLHLVAARTALDRFTELNAQLITLSRSNTNVRSLALSLGRKRLLTAACEENLRAIEDALATRGFTATR